MSGGMSEGFIKEFIREINCFIGLNHQNIVKFFGGSAHPYPSLVTEF